MSEHGLGSGAADADHHHEYLGEPANEAPGEPTTPGWLTLLGVGLVLILMLGFLATRPDGKTRAELAGAPSANPAAAPAAPKAQPPTPAPEARPANPIPQGFRPPGMASALGAARPAARPVRPAAPE